MLNIYVVQNDPFCCLSYDHTPPTLDSALEIAQQFLEEYWSDFKKIRRRKAGGKVNDLFWDMYRIIEIFFKIFCEYVCSLRLKNYPQAVKSTLNQLEVLALELWRSGK